jgi:predicted secreted protein
MSVNLRDIDSILAAALRDLASAILLRVDRSRTPSLAALAGEVMNYFEAPAMTNPSAAIPRERREEVERALAEGWAYLERHGLVAANARGRGYFVTRRARNVIDGALPFPTEPHAGPRLSF